MIAKIISILIPLDNPTDELLISETGLLPCLGYFKKKGEIK